MSRNNVAAIPTAVVELAAVTVEQGRGCAESAGAVVGTHVDEEVGCCKDWN